MEFFFNPVTGRVEQRQVNNNLPFRSMTELASEINQFPFLPPSPTVPLDAFKNTVAPMAVNTGINNTIPAAMFLDTYTDFTIATAVTGILRTVVIFVLANTILAFL